MKKILSLILALTCMLVVTGCSQENIQKEKDNQASPTYSESGSRSAIDAPIFNNSVEGEPRPDILMTLMVEDGTLSFTIINQGQESLSHPNGGAATIQICLEDIWYELPSASRSITTEMNGLEPNQSYSHIVPLEPYRDVLSDGHYRVALFFIHSWKNGEYQNNGFAAAEFSIQSGEFVLE